MRFDKKEKLSPRYVSPYEILERVGELAYRLAMPPELSQIHDVFHICMLKKYVPKTFHVMQLTPVELQHDLSYVVEPVHILRREMKQLYSKTIPLVKVQW